MPLLESKRMRTKCAGGSPPIDHATNPMFYEPQPFLRFCLLKELQDVLGGWDARLKLSGGKQASNLLIAYLISLTECR